jgi:hypothetical protein
MDCKQCKKCGARFFPNETGGYHLRWATGSIGKAEDLAGLVCIPYGNDECINPMRHDTSGDTWGKRLAELKALEDLHGL